MFEELSFLSLVSDVIRPVLSWTTDCLNGTSVAGQGTREHARQFYPCRRSCGASSFTHRVKIDTLG